MKTILSILLFTVFFGTSLIAQDIPEPPPPPVLEDKDKVFFKVEKEAEPNFDWATFLIKNLNPDVPVVNKAPKGRYTVVIKFVVTKDGDLTNIIAEKDPGFGTANEAIRVLKRSPKWKPGIQDGHKVNSWHRQPITFLVP